MSSAGSHLSREFFELLKSIGESKSKQEEDRIVARDVAVLKSRLADKKLSKKVFASSKDRKEFLLRIMCVVRHGMNYFK